MKLREGLLLGFAEITDSPAFWQRRFYDFNVCTLRVRRRKCVEVSVPPAARLPGDLIRSPGGRRPHGRRLRLALFQPEVHQVDFGLLVGDDLLRQPAHLWISAV